MKRLFVTFVSCLVLLSATVTTPALAEVKDEAEQSNVGVFQDALTTAADGIQSVLNGVKTSIEGLCATSEQIVLENCESAQASESVASQNAVSAAAIPSNLDGVVWSPDYSTCTLQSGYSVDGQALLNEIQSHHSSLTTFVAENNTSLTGSAESLFSMCYELRVVDLADSFDTSQINNMSGMFDYCDSLTSLTFPESFNTGNVEKMANMFANCTSLTSLTLPESFNTGAVMSMERMFSNCYSLPSLTLPAAFATDEVTTMNQMFWNCRNLTTLTLPETFTMMAGTYLSDLYGSTSGYWTTSMTNAVSDNDQENASVAAINDVLSKLPTDGAQTFKKVALRLAYDANGGQFGAVIPAMTEAYLYGNENDAISGTQSGQEFDYTPIPKRSGYSYKGYAGTDTATTPETPTNFPEASATYYAVWTPVIAITFDTNGHASFAGDQKTLSIDCVPGEKLTLPAEDALTVEPSYIFNGWFTEVTGGTQVTDETDCPATATTYYAQYTKEPGPTPDPTPEPTPDVVPASDTDALPLTGDTSAARTGAVIAVLMGTVALLACGYSLTRKRLQ